MGKIRKIHLNTKAKAILFGIPLLVLLFGYLGGLSAQAAYQVISGSFKFGQVSFNPITAWAIAFFEPFGRLITLVVFAATVLLLLLSRWRDNILDLVAFTDDRGVGFAKRGTYGTAMWMRKKDIEASQDLDLRPIGSTDGFILAQLDKKAKEVVSLKTKRKGNFNIAVLGASGTGKSAGFVRANTLNAIERGESVVLTDPKGELYMDFYKYCVDKGINTKVFNLLYPEYSDAWDIMSETIHPDTGEADPDRMASLATVIIENTGTSKEAIWNDGPKNLISAIGLWAMWRKESYLRNAYKAIFDELADGGFLENFTPQWIDWARKALHPKCSVVLKKREEIVMSALENSTMSSEEAKKDLWNRYTLGCPEASLATIYQTLAEFGDNVGHLFADMPSGHPGKIAYNFYEQAGEKVKSSFNQGLGVRLRLLQSRAMRRIIRNKDIDLADVGAHQTVIFVVIPDQDTSTRAISSMFFTFLFKDLADEYTRTQGQGRIPVNIILDEFANIGTIPDFAQKMSISRSRKINISYILQSPSQLEAVYGRENAPTIIAGCDTMLFLGSNEPDTCKYISRRTGEATISVNTIKNSRGVARPDAVGKEYQESAGEGKRFVMTEHEVSQMSKDECLVFLTGHNVLKANKFWWWYHPLSNGGKLSPTLITDHVRASVKYQATEFKDPFLQDKNASFNLEEFEGEVLNPGVKKKEKISEQPKVGKGTVPEKQPVKEETSPKQKLSGKKQKKKKTSLLDLILGPRRAPKERKTPSAPRKGRQEKPKPGKPSPTPTEKPAREGLSQRRVAGKPKSAAKASTKEKPMPAAPEPQKCENPDVATAVSAIPIEKESAVASPVIAQKRPDPPVEPPVEEEVVADLSAITGPPAAKKKRRRKGVDEKNTREMDALGAGL